MLSLHSLSGEEAQLTFSETKQYTLFRRDRINDFIMSTPNIIQNYFVALLIENASINGQHRLQNGEHSSLDLS